MQVCDILLQLLIAYRLDYKVEYRAPEAIAPDVMPPAEKNNGDTTQHPHKPEPAHRTLDMGEERCEEDDDEKEQRLLVVCCKPVRNTWERRRKMVALVRTRSQDADPLTVERLASDLAWEEDAATTKKLDFDLKVVEVKGGEGLLELHLLPSLKDCAVLYKKLFQSFFDRKSLSRLISFYTVPERS